jgi:hypothetical protein
MIDDDIENLFDEGDPFDHPLWQQAAWAAHEAEAGFQGIDPGWIGCSLAWLAWVMPCVETAKQLALALWVYRKCALTHHQIVNLPNGELRSLGISRQAKYRALARLERKGVLVIEPQSHGKSISVRLLGPWATCPAYADTCLPHNKEKKER